MTSGSLGHLMKITIGPMYNLQQNVERSNINFDWSLNPKADSDLAKTDQELHPVASEVE